MPDNLKRLRWFSLCILVVVFIGSFALPYVSYSNVLSSLFSGEDSIRGLSAFDLMRYSRGWPAAVSSSVILLSLGACVLISISFSGSVTGALSRGFDVGAIGLAATSAIIHIVLIARVKELQFIFRGAAFLLPDPALGDPINGMWPSASPGFGCYLNLCLLIIAAALSGYLCSQTSGYAVVTKSMGARSVNAPPMGAQVAAAYSDGERQNKRNYNAIELVQKRPPPDNFGVIIGVTGMFRYATFKISDGEELVFGRDAAFSHVIVDQDAEKVSRKHCSIVFSRHDQQYYVTDHSSNGTYAENGGQLPPEMRTVMPRGSLILLGDRNNCFRLS